MGGIQMLNSKYGKVLSVVLVIAILIIIGFLVFTLVIGYLVYVFFG